VNVCLSGAATGRPYSFSTETSVALITAKTLSPSLSRIRFTEPLVIIDVTSPAAVWMTISDTTLSETIFSIRPGRRFRMLVLMLHSFPQLVEPVESLSKRVHELSTPTEVTSFSPSFRLTFCCNSGRARFCWTVAAQSQDCSIRVFFVRVVAWRE
jgi:hypothetical protein